MVIKPLEKKDNELLLKIYCMKARDIYPAMPADPSQAAFFGSLDPSFINSEFAGIYEKNSLKAAIYFGVLSKESKPRDFNIIKPGDGIISWMLCAEQKAGDKLLKYALKKLKRKVFAFPEDGGGLIKFNIFNNGMLPSVFKMEEAALKKNGFKLPKSKDWGIQERFWFKRDIEKNIKPAIPKGFKTSREIYGKLSSSLKIFDKKKFNSVCSMGKTGRFGKKERAVGECSVGEAKRFGKPYPGHIYINWLFVDKAYRGKALGQYLLLSQLKWAYENGAKVSVLTTHSGAPAHKLYRKLGYKEICLSKTYCRMKGE